MWCVCGCSRRDDVCRVCEYYRGDIVVMYVTAFHLWNKYLGVTLDRTSDYKQHIHKTKMKDRNTQQSIKKVVKFKMGCK